MVVNHSPDTPVTFCNGTSTLRIDEIGTLISILRNKHRDGRPWQSIADDYGVQKVVPYRIVEDNYEPKDNVIRRKLGLPYIIKALSHVPYPTGIWIPDTAQVKTCPVCNKRFVRIANRQIFCSHDCRMYNVVLKEAEWSVPFGSI